MQLKYSAIINIFQPYQNKGKQKLLVHTQMYYYHKKRLIC